MLYVLTTCGAMELVFLLLFLILLLILLLPSPTRA